MMSRCNARPLVSLHPPDSLLGMFLFPIRLRKVLESIYDSNMKKVLVVQSRTTPEMIEREQKNFRRAIGALADITFLSALDERLAWSTPDEFLEDIDGVIFGGSSDFDFNGGRAEKGPARIMSIIILSRTKSFVSYTLAEKIPLLGICYGHQLVANMYGGDVDHDESQSKFGAHEVCLSTDGMEDPLLKDLPERFLAQYAHKDSITKLPVGATLLAGGSKCKFSALRYGDTAYTLQFHPEIERLGTTEHGPASPHASRIIPLWIERITA